MVEAARYYSTALREPALYLFFGHPSAFWDTVMLRQNAATCTFLQPGCAQIWSQAGCVSKNEVFEGFDCPGTPIIVPFCSAELGYQHLAYNVAWTVITFENVVIVWVTLLVRFLIRC